MPYSTIFNDTHTQSNKQIQIKYTISNKTGVVGVHYEKDRKNGALIFHMLMTWALSIV